MSRLDPDMQEALDAKLRKVREESKLHPRCVRCTTGLQVIGCLVCKDLWEKQKSMENLRPTGEVKDDKGRSLTAHEFSCKILEQLNAGLTVQTIEIRTLCIMLQYQASQLRQIRAMAGEIPTGYSPQYYPDPNHKPA